MFRSARSRGPKARGYVSAEDASKIRTGFAPLTTAFRYARHLLILKEPALIERRYSWHFLLNRIFLGEFCLRISLSYIGAAAQDVETHTLFL